MALNLLVSLSLLTGTRVKGADTADDYYHRGAQHYVFGEKEQAKTEVTTGRRLFPNDPKLSQLAGYLKEEEKKEQQKQQQKQDQQKQDHQKQDHEDRRRHPRRLSLHAIHVGS